MNNLNIIYNECRFRHWKVSYELWSTSEMICSFWLFLFLFVLLGELSLFSEQDEIGCETLRWQMLYNNSIKKRSCQNQHSSEPLTAAMCSVMHNIIRLILSYLVANMVLPVFSYSCEPTLQCHCWHLFLKCSDEVQTKWPEMQPPLSHVCQKMEVPFYLWFNASKSTILPLHAVSMTCTNKLPGHGQSDRSFHVRWN